MENQFWAVGCGLGWTNKRVWVDYDQLLRSVFSLFWGQNFFYKFFENIIASELKLLYCAMNLGGPTSEDNFFGSHDSKFSPSGSKPYALLPSKFHLLHIFVILSSSRRKKLSNGGKISDGISLL